MGWLSRNGGLKTIFSEGSDGFQYEYYVALESKGPVKDIVLEYDIMCEAKYIFKYALIEDKGIFILKIDDRIDGGYSRSDTEIAGENPADAAVRDKAIEYMIQKILEKPKRHIAEQPKLKAIGMPGDFKIDISKLEAALREALAA